MTTPRRVTILGSTGSIGTQALQVVDRYPERLIVHALTCHSRVEVLVEQAKKYRPKYVVVTDTKHLGYLSHALEGTETKVLAGEEALCEVAGDYEADIVLTAIVGFAGLRPTLSAIKAERTIALANKETLVVAGELVMTLSRKHMAPIIPVDSEHSAIFQCINGENHRSLRKIYLTASGGPFVDLGTEELERVTPQQALKHPNWQMGDKVTIDSSTLMNKGLEMIEAKWLFGLEPEAIEVVVHRQSIVHSMVGFSDGSVKAQLGLPQMRLPIAYALLFPNRLDQGIPLPGLEEFHTLTFERPRRNDFRCLDLAFRAIAEGGTSPCVLNAANEIAVERFLHETIRYTDIPRLIENMMDTFGTRTLTSIEQLAEIDAQVRTKAKQWMPSARTVSSC